MAIGRTFECAVSQLTRRPCAVYCDNVAVNELGFVGCEEESRVGDIIRFAAIEWTKVAEGYSTKWI
jgi:hypothetical protein